MREIKLRAWDKRDELHRMMYIRGFFIYGEGWYGGNPEHKFIQLFIGETGFEKFHVNEIELMQYAGIIDKNRKDIYEGDVLVHIQNEKSKKYKQIVEWNDAGFIFKKIKEESGYRPFINSFGWCPHIVIGNIYENPELLK